MDAEDTVKLIFSGRRAWNSWAEEKLAEKSKLEADGASRALWREEAGANFSGISHRKLDCSGFIFPAMANFAGTRVEAGSSFISAKFHGIADFTNATFVEGARFNDARFDEGMKFVNARFQLRPAEFARIEVNGNANFEGATFHMRADFTQAKFLGPADFSSAEFLTATFDNARFSDDASFVGTRFEQNAIWFAARFARNTTFSDAIFSGPAHFSAVEFEGPTAFIQAQFSDNASFRNAKFRGAVDFVGATFQKTFQHLANFENVEFFAKVDFERARFGGLAKFRGALFHRAASFNAISAESSFDMAGAQFYGDIPNFVQAHFVEAPRLDHLSVPTVPELRRVKVPIGTYATARYRALKRLAIQGHDHMRELQFFAGELQSRRGSSDKVWPNLKALIQKGKTALRRRYGPAEPAIGSVFFTRVARTLVAR